MVARKVEVLPRRGVLWVNSQLGGGGRPRKTDNLREKSDTAVSGSGLLISPEIQLRSKKQKNLGGDEREGFTVSQGEGSASLLKNSELGGPGGGLKEARVICQEAVSDPNQTSRSSDSGKGEKGKMRRCQKRTAKEGAQTGLGIEVLWGDHKKAEGKDETPTNLNGRLAGQRPSHLRCGGFLTPK